MESVIKKSDIKKITYGKFKKGRPGLLGTDGRPQAGIAGCTRNDITTVYFLLSNGKTVEGYVYNDVLEFLKEGWKDEKVVLNGTFCQEGYVGHLSINPFMGMLN